MTINDAMGSMPGKRHGLDRTLTCNDFCKDFYINFRSSFSLNNEKIIFIKRPMTNFYFFLLYELVNNKTVFSAQKSRRDACETAHWLICRVFLGLLTPRLGAMYT